jgi:hypothetical protein
VPLHVPSFEREMGQYVHTYGPLPSPGMLPLQVPPPGMRCCRAACRQAGMRPLLVILQALGNIGASPKRPGAWPPRVQDSMAAVYAAGLIDSPMTSPLQLLPSTGPDGHAAGQHPGSWGGFGEHQNVSPGSQPAAWAPGLPLPPHALAAVAAANGGGSGGLLQAGGQAPAAGGSSQHQLAPAMASGDSGAAITLGPSASPARTEGGAVDSSKRSGQQQQPATEQLVTQITEQLSLQMLDDGVAPPAVQPTPALPCVPDDEPGAVANAAPATTTAAATPAPTATATTTATNSGGSLGGADAAVAVSLRPSGMGADSAPTAQGGWTSNGSKPATSHEPPTALQKRQRSVREQLTFEEYEAQYGPAAK